MPFEDITKPPKPLPQPQLREIRNGLFVLPPLSRRGHGPGVIILAPDSPALTRIDDAGVPSPMMKWAEEGYAVAEIQLRALGEEDEETALQDAVRALDAEDTVDTKGKYAILSYIPAIWNRVAPFLDSVSAITAAVTYVDASDVATLATPTTPTLRHIAGSPTSPEHRPIRTEELVEYWYPSVQSCFFAAPFQPLFNYAQESVSHTRNLTFVKPRLGGPYFDLEAIWEEHTYDEFADRSVEHTMSTMVQEPYVNHVPTLTGGVGRGPLSTFYRDNFIFANSVDTQLELVSRTLGIDRIVDEFIMHMTHDQEVDWLVPGIPPTHCKLAIPFTAVVNVRGDRLYHEHIAWDQGTVLRQLGLLPEYLPFPYALPGGQTPAAGKRFEYRVPVVGVAAANKLRERGSEPSNELFEYKLREV
ncbi:hypothetical protein SEUCBS139899_005769 [Sporothrix eucalyptigena]